MKGLTSSETKRIESVSRYGSQGRQPALPQLGRVVLIMELSFHIWRRTTIIVSSILSQNFIGWIGYVKCAES